VASPDHAGEIFRQRCRHELGSAGYSGFPDAAEIRALPPTSLERLAGVLRFPADAARPDLLRAMLPVVINDLLMITSFGCSGASIVDVPITAVHGAFDDRVTEAEMRGWADWTSREYQIRILPGDHFFVHPDQCRDEVIELVTCLKSGIDE
jgi:surfactin synthase thioesterase subunit